MTTHELHTDVFYTPRGLTAYHTNEDIGIMARLRLRSMMGLSHRVSRFRVDILGKTLDAERADRFSYGPSLTTMVDYVTEQVHKETVQQAFAVRS